MITVEIDEALFLGHLCSMAKDGLGDRCKEYELAEASRRAMRGLPLLARLEVVELELPPARKIANLAAVLFERADPVPKT